MGNIKSLQRELRKKKSYRDAEKKLEKDIKYQFSKVVIDFRLKYGLTEENLAKKLGISLITIKKFR